ncbi:MAG: alpha/beta fold hydrolase [Anaerolineaceae bacterium]|nr:alpha/beta fold hydrolase [Anaerolineaceae bacterium]
MKNYLSRVVILILLMTIGVAQITNAQDVPAPVYEPMEGCFTDVLLELDYECGYVTVPAFYDGRTDATIRLAVVRIFAVGEGEKGSPVFFMDGGPGGSLLLNLGLDQFSIATELGLDEDLEAPTPIMDMLEAHDFVLFSQRGTQFSEPVLVCEAADEIGGLAVLQGIDFETQLEQTHSAMQSCIEAFVAEGVDFNAYTNFANADDVNAVREVLGYDQIIFYGESYGAQLGEHVMQQHPDILEAVILDGVNALSKVEWIQDDGYILEQGINKLLALCAADETCAAKLENPETLLEDAFARIQQEPLSATFTVEDTVYTFDITPEILVTSLESMFTSDNRPSIPRALWGLRNGDTSYLANVIGAEATQPSEDAVIAELMHNAMVCSDDPPQPEASYDQSSYSEFARFTEQVFAKMYVGVCETLDLERLPDTSDENPTVDVPTLVLSGGLDVRTPTVRNQEVADALPNSRIIIFEYSDHVQYRGDYAPCASAIVSAFVNDPSSLQDLDASCLNTVFPPVITLPPPTPVDLVGIQFVAAGIFSAGEFFLIPEGSQFSVTFNDAEQMTIVADCNTILATYTVDESGAFSMSLGPSTLVACPEGSPVNEFMSVLEGVTTIEITDFGDQYKLVLETDEATTYIPFTATK